MSRLGKKTILLSAGLKANYKKRVLNVKGPQGEMQLNIPDVIDLELEETNIKIVTDFYNSQERMIAGTIGSLIGNMVYGVNKGFAKTLELVGVGYRAQLKGKKLTLSLGYSHPVEYQLPEIVKAQLEGNNKIVLTSCDKQALGQTAAEIRKFRPPEPYKGKGILFAGENIRRKAGKASKASA